MAEDLELAVGALVSQQSVYDRYWRYYEGDHPLRYSTQRMAALFRELDVRFTQNWCAVVVDAAMDRLNLSGFSVSGNEAVTDQLNGLFRATELNLDSDDAHLAALVCGDSYVIVWKNAETGEPEAFYNDPRFVHIQYDAENPREKAWAAKWWVGDDGCYKLTIYYLDRLEYYSTAKPVDRVDSWKAFQPAEEATAPNPFGVIPVFHLRRERRAIKSELTDAIPLQDAINKLLNDMMVAAEFGAFRQRWVISTANVDALRNAPNEIWNLPAGTGGEQGTSVGEFSQTDLSVYLAAIDKLAMSMAIITRTPKYYMYAQGGDPSGEALITMEAPLVRKCQRYIERFTTPWRKIAAFLLQLDGVTVDPDDILPVFDSTETVQPRTEAEIREIGVRTGVPLITLLREEGKDGAWLAAMEADSADAKKGQQASLASALLSAQRQFDQGGKEVPGQAGNEVLGRVGNGVEV